MAPLPWEFRHGKEDRHTYRRVSNDKEIIHLSQLVSCRGKFKIGFETQEWSSQI